MGRASAKSKRATTRFLYVTDLHGHAGAYRSLPDLCREHGVHMIVNGGDMLPKGGDLFTMQRAFLKNDFMTFVHACALQEILFFGMFGNDDLRGVHDAWVDLVAAHAGVFDLTERWHTLPGGYTIRGCSWVPDYPFGLKDWCLRDRPDAPPVPTRGRSVITTAEGIVDIRDPAAFFRARPTLGEYLEELVEGAAIDQAILVSHAPPAGLRLGTLWNGEDVGSLAVRDWIVKHQPLLTLSGHIHESPDAEHSRRGEFSHTAALGRTTCHQPGQRLPRGLTYSIVDLRAGGPPVVEWLHVNAPM